MPKRRLSGRQLERIRAIQDRRRQRLEARTELVLEQLDDDEPRAGRVVVRHGASLAVEDAQGLIHHCQTRRNIGHPVCGDRVVWQPAEAGAGVVTALQPRDTELSRPDYSGRDKALAANISLMVIVVATRPEPSGYLVDQYLVAAELIGVDAVIAVNKMDLLAPDEQGDFLQAFHHYAKIGCPVLPVSVKGAPGLDQLLPHLTDQTAILLGQSGVGKSSLINALLPDQELQIGRLSGATGLGRHTTSAATCYRVGNRGHLIDSPGVRSFRLGEIARGDLERGFREFAPHLGRCRFTDCSHRHEPDCAIRAAVDGGTIAPQRLDNFHLLVAEADRAGH
ncbi:MAG: ribosome small subunit-dependent GTPase A [Thiohalocapsa sp.]